MHTALSSLKESGKKERNTPCVWCAFDGRVTHTRILGKLQLRRNPTPPLMKRTSMFLRPTPRPKAQTRKGLADEELEIFGGVPFKGGKQSHLGLAMDVGSPLLIKENTSRGRGWNLNQGREWKGKKKLALCF